MNTKIKYTPDTIPEEYRHLFDTNIYKTHGGYNGAGYKKFKIVSIMMNLKKENPRIQCELRGTAWKPKAKNILVRFTLIEDKLVPLSYFYFTDLVPWFIKRYLVIFRLDMLDAEDYKQFIHEYKEIKNKYPEYFL